MQESRQSKLTDRERRDWLRLIRSEGVGPVTFRRLLDRYGTAGTALAALPAIAGKAGREALRIADGAEAEREIAALCHIGGQLIAMDEPEYPAALRAIDDSPPLLAVLGDVATLTRPAVGIVGSRNASLNGRRVAEGLARDLAAAGWIIVSGLARGIDSAAHAGALRGGTVAVLAGGVDVCYPEENRALYQRIAEIGAVISEAPLGTVPQARHFPRRNRLISGLTRGVVVVEASLHSGSRITARFALEQGREVFAVPGSPLDPRARGSNDLLRQGATLVETADDVLNVLTLDKQFRLAEPPVIGDTASGRQAASETDIALAPETATDAETRLAETLSPTPTAVDEIIRTSRLPASLVATILLEWELNGRLERHPGNRVSLTATRSGA
jgi:DNA processing protein